MTRDAWVRISLIAVLCACGGGGDSSANSANSANSASSATGSAEPRPAPNAADAARAIAGDSVRAPADLSKLRSNIPKAVTDTFTFRPLRVQQIPDAPLALMDAAEREQGISRFCYQEFGQKIDPKLIGAVALVVTVERNTIVNVRVGADDWSSSAGRAVDRCLTQKVPQAWKLLPDAQIADGKYVVQLQFRPS